ncbi:hypothetical protein CAP36_09105 [Chitinophagaceae bacterium IBVUCB2]|nr:hypothetical protein CAP36_09105 [Chitinophagaceae bacterium IBVUCB2]
MKKRVQAFFNPEQYHGWGKTKNYFEGWYFKVVNEAETKALAFIPGIAMDQQGNKQSFIQVLDGKRKTSVYHKFDVTDFVPTAGKFSVEILNNQFSAAQIDLQLPGIEGRLEFSGNIPWPTKIHSPGIMGPFAFVPFMECYHGIVSMDHHIAGELKINNELFDFTNGRGYMEKDWGRSFPAAYVWMQTNHFSEPGISLKTSVAKIPWLRKSFVGFIGGLWLNNKLYRFTTYNGSSLRKSAITEKKVELVIENSTYRIEILAHRDEGTALASPIGGLMDGRVEESMTAEVEVQLLNKKTKQIVFEDTGRNAGLEVAGKIEEIML